MSVKIIKKFLAFYISNILTSKYPIINVGIVAINFRNCYKEKPTNIII